MEICWTHYPTLRVDQAENSQLQSLKKDRRDRIWKEGKIICEGRRRWDMKEVEKYNLEISFHCAELLHVHARVEWRQTFPRSNKRESEEIVQNHKISLDDDRKLFIGEFHEKHENYLNQRTRKMMRISRHFDQEQASSCWAKRRQKKIAFGRSFLQSPKKPFSLVFVPWQQLIINEISVLLPYKFNRMILMNRRKFLRCVTS